MWNRAELKTNAKQVLKNFYWKAVLACLIVGLLTGGLFSSAGSASSSAEDIIYSGSSGAYMGNAEDHAAFLAVFMVVFLVALLVGLVLGLALLLAALWKWAGNATLWKTAATPAALKLFSSLLTAANTATWPKQCF